MQSLELYIHLLASRKNVQKLQSLALATEQGFDLVLSKLKLKQHSALFSCVFNPELVAKLPSEVWQKLMQVFIQRNEFEVFEQHFEPEKFSGLTPYAKSKLTRLFCLRFAFARALLLQLFELGAKVDEPMLGDVKPFHTNFDLVMKFAEPELIALWLDERLKNALRDCKHPANYSGKAKRYLTAGYGWWEHSALRALAEFRLSVLIYQAEEHPLTADWLLFAVLTEDVTLLQQCVAQFVDVNQKASNGMLPLVEAAGRHSNEWALNALLQAGALPNLRDGNGFSPLFAALAAKKPNQVFIEQLLTAGADPNFRDFSHATLLQTFGRRLPKHIVEKLQQSGGWAHKAYQPPAEFCCFQDFKLTQTLQELSE
ncbi:hypothetical protein [Vibrio sp. CAU 1672]|uniref:ankyrin repeat domain-containing protein n=1 Tax=Vibrio sp. CAU 1672 TaxID=3032594 RepID=UPI0023DA61CD|nr:hypothetical protein [Vibrio sp. CAU 1672]MDF2154519.1 hypothetical protein [Vibrio sp. CAU 1672]